MINNKRYVTEDNLRTYTAALSDKQKSQLLVINGEIKALDQKIDDEQTRAESSENALQQNINSEASRAQAAETQLQSNLDDADSALRDIISADKSELQKNIDKEVQDRKDAITANQTDYDRKIAALDKSITDTSTGAIATNINTLAGTLRTELDQTRESLEESISQLTSVVNTNQQNNVSTDNELNERITTEIASLDTKIINHNNQYSTLNSQVQSHIENVSNPHNVTRDQIGAAAQTDFVDLEARVTKNESDISSNDADISNIQTNAQALTQRVVANESDISSLKSSKLNNFGNEILKGSLTVAKNNDGSALDGDLIVQGDLIVNGKTTTQDHETINVKDNFIVVNSDNETLGTTPAGIAIQTGTVPYIIAYEEEGLDEDGKPKGNVSLGYGIYSNGSFSFATNEKKPILTRSGILYDKHLLIWDAATNTAVDGGLYDEESLKKTFATWTAYNTLVDEVRNNDVDIANLQEEDIRINANIDQIEAHDVQQDNRLDTAESDIDTLENVKQNITDNTLKTDAKTIPASINEVHDQLEAHEALRNNPHNVTWAQINSAALNNINPLMDGVANPGTLTTVSRSDHVHPTDTSRAPVSHASGSTMYGQATTSEYGHVIVDDTMSDAKTNPVQNKVIKKYVDDSIAGLDVSAISVSANETISSISETDGKIAVTKQLIQISESQVNNLETDLTNIRNNTNRVESESKARDTILQNNIDTTNTRIGTEEARAKNAESTLDSAIKAEASTRLASDNALQDNLDAVEANLQANIDSNADRIADLEETVETVQDLNSSIQSIQEQVTADNYSKRWVLSFEPELDSANNVVGYKPVFTNMDDGELT